MISDSVSVLTVENNFWSIDHSALHTLHDRLKHSNDSTKAILNYFDQRAKIEEEYSHKLLQLSESVSQIEDCFHVITEATEMSARAHMELSYQMLNMFKLPLDEFVQEQHDLQSHIIDKMNGSNHKKTLLDEQVKKARERYVKECRKSNASVKKIDLLDCEYQQAINIMRSSSAEWIYDWRESCKLFQLTELNRMEYLKTTVKNFSNILGNTVSADDQTCERMLIRMEDMQPIHEMNRFIETCKTGSSEPELPKYTKYRPLQDGFDNVEDDSSKRKILMPKNISPERAFKEINIPTQNNEELRSVNDQLKKLPSPVDSGSTDKNVPPKLETSAPHPYPLNPVYTKSRTAVPSKSDPALNNSFRDWYLEDLSKDSLPVFAEQLIDDSQQLPPIKKPSVLSFLKKKKKPEDSQKDSHCKKRLSIDYTMYSADKKLTSAVFSPSSPIFSPTDFYYSPAMEK